MLEVKNLNKTVGGKQILKELSFEIKRGEIALFLGGSGVGKSTLLRVCNHLENYDTGSFFLDGKPLNLATVSRDHTVGMVFQQFNLFEHLSVEKNIMLALMKCQGKSQSVAHQMAHDILERYELADKAKASVHTLSGGQKQRLAIARTVALNPQIICLDEPTSALDPRLTSQVAGYISEMAADNRIVLLTTHDMGLLSALKAHLFLMQEGTIVESAASERYYSSPSQFPSLSRFIAS